MKRSKVTCGGGIVKFVIKSTGIIVLFYAGYIYGVNTKENGVGRAERERARFSPRVLGVNTDEEFKWCQDILSHFEGGAEQWSYKKQSFASQNQQDWLVYSSMFRSMDRDGVYVDLAAHDPWRLSNTFFLDKCVGWKGLCIEADTEHVNNLRARRSCEVIDTCIWEEPKEIAFRTLPNTGKNGLGELAKK